MSDNIVKMRAKKAPKVPELDADLFKNPYVIVGIGVAIGLIIYYLYKKNGGPTTDGGTHAPVENLGHPVKTSMDMAVIPGARTN